MTARVLDLGFCRCAVVASDAVTDRMHAYLEPFVAIENGRRSHVTVSISCDPQAVDITRRLFSARPPVAHRTAHPGQRYLVWIVDDHEVLLPEWPADHVIDTAPGAITVTGADCEIAATIGTRVVRQLIMRGNENRGGVTVHAGSVAIGGDGVLIGGQAGSGKTTILSTLLERHAVPISGDRTVVLDNGHGWQAVAVPLAWRFTPEGLAGSMPLARAWPHMTPARGTALVEGKAELTPREIGTVYGCTPKHAAAVRRVIVLERSTKPSPAEIDGELLRRHMDFGSGDALRADWLNLFSRDLDRTHAEETHWWTRLASSVPVLALTWTHPAQFPQLAATIGNWLRS